MLVSVASECHKKQSVLHFVNATPKVAQSISSTLPSADIAFLPKVMSSWFNEQPYGKPYISYDWNPFHSVKVDKDDVTNEIQMEEIAA
jgi:sodium-independent sulfate anion transporter 11